MEVSVILDEIKNKVLERLNEVLSLRNQRKEKQDLSFVTEGDFLINRIIEDIVKEYRDASIELISEESVTKRLIDAEGYIIVVDPIDGTENFSSGLPEWGISVS
jgi:myo-inositol-1(or 4)-monophosphatase